VNFLYPLFTLAGLAIAIPILIHLFNFRRYKRVFFPDIRFLKELQEQTRKHSQLKNLLILACRILAILALVFAFAQPFFSADKDKMDQGPKAVSIYIDNSFSMGIENKAISLLDKARTKAREIIETLGTNDKIQILTNDFAYNENRFLSREDALRQLGSIHLSPRNRNAQTVLEKQKQLLQTEPGMRKQIVYISDFQQSSFSENLEAKDSIKKYFVPVRAEAINNISLDTVSFETPSILLNQPNPLSVELKNNSTEEANTSVSVMVNNQLKSVTNVSLKAGENKTQSISFSTATAGNQLIKVFITDYPVSFDDTFYVAGKANSNYAVLVINQSNANAYLSSVFKPGVQFRLDNTNVNAVKTDLLKNYSLIILNGISQLPEGLSTALQTHLNDGGSILTFAPSQAESGNINSFLSQTAGCTFEQFDTSRTLVSDYNKAHTLFRDLFTRTPENIELPVAYKHYSLSRTSLSNEQKLFSFANSDAFLSAFRVGNGSLYVCTSPAEANASNFPKSYWFLPLIYKMAYMNAANPLYALSIGRNAGISIQNTRIGDKTVYHISNGQIDAIPEQRAAGNQMQLNVNSAIQQAGLYHVYLPESTDSTFVGINYDRNESALTYWDTKTLQQNTRLKNAEWIGDHFNAAGTITEWQHGMPLWKVCITLALLFLLCEILLIRFFK